MTRDHYNQQSLGRELNRSVKDVSTTMASAAITDEARATVDLLLVRMAAALRIR